MITQEKFFKAVEKVKAGGCWSLGLIIGKKSAIAPEAMLHKQETAVIDDSSAAEGFANVLLRAFARDSWVILEIKKNIPAEVYTQLKLLTAQNRIQLSNGEAVRQPDSVRIIAVVEKKTLRSIEAIYPDFRHMFGPVITV